MHALTVVEALLDERHDVRDRYRRIAREQSRMRTAPRALSTTTTGFTGLRSACPKAALSAEDASQHQTQGRTPESRGHYPVAS